MTPRAADADLVHGPLPRWAAERPAAAAICSDGGLHISFAELQQTVAQRARALATAQAPEAVLVDAQGSIPQRLIDFLAIIASGRCAAVADAEWPAHIRTQLAQAIPSGPLCAAAPTGDAPFYIGFTSGSTGLPKGFMRSHRSWAESFRVCIDVFGPAATGRVLAPGSFSHSLFLFGMMLGLWTGAGVIVQERFSAERTLATLGQGDVPCLVAVPSQLQLMLALAQRRALPPQHGVQLIMISGARWMRHRTPELRALFPRARIVEFYGASETSFIAWMDADEQADAQVVGKPFPGVDIDIRHRDSPHGAGMIFVRSAMLFTDYVGTGADPTAAVREDGWLSVRDIGYLNAKGYLCLVGRQNRMIVTSGKNLFPEEVEACLSTCPGVAAASVHGVPDTLRGMHVVALIQPAPNPTGTPPPHPAHLANWCRQHLAAYKVPRRFILCPHWPLTASGKTDHQALALWLQEQQML